MTTKAQIKAALEDVTHASQTKSVVAMLLGYLDEAGVESPDEAKEREEHEVYERKHREVAEAQTIKDLDAAVSGWGADEAPDEDLQRAVDERRAYLAGVEQDAADKDAANAPDYESMSYSELQAEARRRQLPATGKSADLVARLKEDDDAAPADKASDESTASGGEQTVVSGESTAPADETTNQQPAA